MTTKQAREGLIPRIAGTLEEHGFKFVKKRGEFEKSAPDFLPRFGFAEIDTGQGIEFRPSASLRAEQVEAIVNRASQTAPATARYSTTVGAELGRIAGEIERWRTIVKAEEGLDAAAALMSQAFMRIALPFYREYSSLQAIDLHVNSNPEMVAILCRADLRRAEVGVVVARLLARPDLPDLIEAHRRQLRFIYEREVPDFEEFLVRLNGA